MRQNNHQMMVYHFISFWIRCVSFLLSLALSHTHTHTQTIQPTGTHYTSITNFMQGYIDNEINLNDERRCDGTCSDFKSTKNHECQNGTLCAHRNFARTRCTGDMFDCNAIDSNGIACLVVCSLNCYS